MSILSLSLDSSKSNSRAKASAGLFLQAGCRCCHRAHPVSRSNEEWVGKPGYQCGVLTTPGMIILRFCVMYTAGSPQLFPAVIHTWSLEINPTISNFHTWESIISFLFPSLSLNTVILFHRTVIYIMLFQVSCSSSFIEFFSFFCILFYISKFQFLFANKANQYQTSSIP